MFADQDTNVVYLSELFLCRYPGIAKRVCKALDAAGVRVGIMSCTYDIWVRDFLPVQVGHRRFVQFRYDPPYLKGDELFITPPGAARFLPQVRHCTISPIRLDGGNVVRWRDAAIMTDRLYAWNRDQRPSALRRAVQELLAVDRLIVIPSEPHDGLGHAEDFGHADGIVRFLDANTVLINDYSRAHPTYHRSLTACLRRHKLGYVPIPYQPSNEKKSGVWSATGCYLNFLQVRGVVIAPVYGIPTDAPAIRALRKAFHPTPVVTVESSLLAQEGGVLNCIAWNIALPLRPTVAERTARLLPRPQQWR